MNVNISRNWYFYRIIRRSILLSKFRFILYVQYWLLKWLTWLLKLFKLITRQIQCYNNVIKTENCCFIYPNAVVSQLVSVTIEVLQRLRNIKFVKVNRQLSNFLKREEQYIFSWYFTRWIREIPTSSLFYRRFNIDFHVTNIYILKYIFIFYIYIYILKYIYFSRYEIFII